jgi:hypothetical protein
MNTIPQALRINTVHPITRNQGRYNRASMLAFLLSALPWARGTKPLKVPRYTKRLDLEITRIAKLPNPERTVCAIALYKAWQDSRTATECIRREREIYQELQKSGASVEDLRKKVLTQE